MSRYPGPPASSQGQPMSSVGGYQSSGMSTHMASPQTVPPYSVAVASPSQYVQQTGPSPNQTHYTHPSPQQPMMTAPGYGQPMMHGIMPPQAVMQPQQPPPPQQPQQQQPPQPQQQPAQPQHPVQQQDDLAIKVKRSFSNFDTSLKTFLQEYSSVLQMDDARLNSQTPDLLAQSSQNLVRRYETLLVALDLFESNLRMLQDYTSTQNNFRRYMPPPTMVAESSAHSGHQSMQISAHIGRAVDPIQYQFLLNKMQTQIDSFNALHDLGKKFLEASSTNVNTNITTK
ncbi:unnamed protein product [Rotaria socialis]|uniref:Uncharacterized protein n=1 Tax=Rotaria socialis TaxID=392032 RepID=A0A820K3X7_9BILA|nr:unnamed protein product [Rotaria socialis]CAF3197184.1 unnamed protein product [Rotaria socialis]CAF3317608.1 unnamed protein product [Rotaria socialis]CAF3326837.1 unnamed protein product [Rotaria socialis]CAF3330316.1 unnamed protein product [Rotaria socialis]